MDRRAHGRPPATNHAAIERAAFRLFAERGFAATTVDDIADEVGVSRRTLFRYYASKNDIPWGQFQQSLEDFAALLGDMPEELSLYDAVGRAVCAFNDFPEAAMPAHRERMRLILGNPELQAHSFHQYRAWRSVIADYVARRLRLGREDVLPQLVGHVSLALAMTAYERWLTEADDDLQATLRQAMALLREYAAPTSTLSRDVR